MRSDENANTVIFIFSIYGMFRWKISGTVILSEQAMYITSNKNDFRSGYNLSMQ